VGQTHRKGAERVAEELRRARANLMGVVLNRARSGRAGYSYGYYYYYHYRDGERQRRRRNKGGVLGWLGDLTGSRNGSNGDGVPESSRERDVAPPAS
jgi:hypothetical protein